MYYVQIRATFSNEITADTIVKVTVTDINDNLPVATAQPFQATITPNFPIGSIISKISATDLDLSSVFTYTITSGNTRGLFSIDSSGIVKTISCITEQDAGTVISLVIRVSDGTNHVDVPLSISIRSTGDRFFVGNCGKDCPTNYGMPHTYSFGQGLYVITASEDIALNRKLADFSLKGSFSNVTYSIVEITTSFMMNGSSLVLKNSLDYETTKNHYFRVQAMVATNFGGVVTSEVGVLVIVSDVNDVAPTIVSQGIITVSDTSVVGQPIGCIKVLDPDTQNSIQYTVIGQSPFGITADGFIIVRADLSSRTGELITMSVRVSDGRNQVTSSVSVQVHQTTYTAELSEDAVIGTVVLRLSSLNTGFIYSLQNTYGGVFTINSTAGSLDYFRNFISFSLSFNRSRMPEYLASKNEVARQHFSSLTLNVKQIFYYLFI